MKEAVWSHYGRWEAVILWIILYGLFVAFIPFYKKSQKHPTSVYLAFVVAFALEMFGIPFSLYVVTWLFGFTPKKTGSAVAPSIHCGAQARRELSLSAVNIS